jgi:hypothetical protein
VAEWRRLTRLDLLRVWWWEKRHEVHWVSADVEPRITTLEPMDDVDDSARIQAAIDFVESSVPQRYRERRARWEARGRRFWIREPILRQQVRLISGPFQLSRPIVVSDRLKLKGVGRG